MYTVREVFDLKVVLEVQFPSFRTKGEKIVQHLPTGFNTNTHFLSIIHNLISLLYIKMLS